MYKPGLRPRKSTLVKICIDEEEYKNEDRHRRLGLSDTPGSFYPLSCEDEEEELKSEEAEEEEEKFTSILEVPPEPVKPHTRSRKRVPFKPPRKPHPRGNFPELPIFCGIESFEIIKAPPSCDELERNPSSVSKSNSDISSQYEWIAADFIPDQETLFSNTQIVSTESDSTMSGGRRYAGGKDDDAPDDRDAHNLHNDIEEDEKIMPDGMQIISSPTTSNGPPGNETQSSEAEEETKIQDTEEAKVPDEEASNENSAGQANKGQNATWSDFELTHASVMGPTLDDILYWLAPMLGITGRRPSNNGSESGEPVANDPPPEMLEMLHGMLGPPPDESILSGLQSFFRMLGLVSSEKAVDDEDEEPSESAQAEKEKKAKEQEKIETQTYEVRRVSNTYVNKKTEDPRDPYMRELIRPAGTSDQEGMSSSEQSSTIQGSRQCSSTSRCSRPDCALNTSQVSSQFIRSRASDSRCVCTRQNPRKQTGAVTERQISCQGMPACTSTRQISTTTSSQRKQISCHRKPKTFSTQATQSHAEASTSQSQTPKQQMPRKKKSAHKSSHKAGSKSTRQVHKGKSPEKAPQIAGQKATPRVLKRRTERKEETTKYGLRIKPQRIAQDSTGESDDEAYKVVTYYPVYEPDEIIEQEQEQPNQRGNTYTVVKEIIEDVEMPPEQGMFGETYTVVKETTRDTEMPTEEQNVFDKTYTVVTETKQDVKRPTTKQNAYSRNYTETTETTAEGQMYPMSSRQVYDTESSTDRESIAIVEDRDREVTYGEDTYQEDTFREDVDRQVLPREATYSESTDIDRKDTYREDVDRLVPPREARYGESTDIYREDTYIEDTVRQVPPREARYSESSDVYRKDTYRKDVDRLVPHREARPGEPTDTYREDTYIEDTYIEDTVRQVPPREAKYSESSDIYRKGTYRKDVDRQVLPREARHGESTDIYRKDTDREPAYRKDSYKPDTHRKEMQREELGREDVDRYIEYEKEEQRDRKMGTPSSNEYKKYDKHSERIPSSRKEQRDPRYSQKQSKEVPKDRRETHKKELEEGLPVSLHEYKKYDKVSSARKEHRDDRMPPIGIKGQYLYKVPSPIEARQIAPTKKGKIRESDYLQKYETARATAPKSAFAEQVSKTDVYDNTGMPISIDESRKEFSPVPLSSHRIVKEGKSRHTRGKSQPAPIKDKEQPTKRRTKSIRKLPKTRSLVSYNKKSPTKLESKSNQTDEMFVRKESSEKLLVSAPLSMSGEYDILKALSLEEVEVTEKEIRKPETTKRTSKNMAVRKRTELRRQKSVLSQTSDEEVGSFHERIKGDRFSLVDIKKYEDQKPPTRSVQTSSDDLGKVTEMKRVVESISSYQSPQKGISSDLEKLKYQEPKIQTSKSTQTSSEDLIKEINIGKDITKDKIESLSKQSLDITALEISVIEPQDKLSYCYKESSSSKQVERSPADEDLIPGSANTLLSAVPDASRSETGLFQYREEKTGSDKSLSKESSIKLSSKVSLNRSNISEKKGSLTSAYTSAEVVPSCGLEKITVKSSSCTCKRKKETAKEKSLLSSITSVTVPITSRQLACEDLTCPFKQQNLPDALEKESSSLLDKMIYGDRGTCPFLRSDISISVENKSGSLVDKTKGDHKPESKLACNDLSCPYLRSDISMFEEKKSDSLLDKTKRDQGRELPFDEPTCPCLRSTTPDVDRKSSSLQSAKTQDKGSVTDRVRMICSSGACGKDSCPAKRKIVDKVESFPSPAKGLPTSDEAAMQARCPCGLPCPCQQPSACKTLRELTQPAPLIGPSGEGASKTEVIKPKKATKPKKSKAADKASQCKCECTCEEEESETKFPKMYTMWALTRVNIYEDESRTYEVMALQPKPSAKIPKTSEVVFVVLPGGNILSMPSTNADTVENVEQPRRWCERPNCRSLFGEVCKKWS